MLAASVHCADAGLRIKASITSNDEFTMRIFIPNEMKGPVLSNDAPPDLVDLGQGADDCDRIHTAKAFLNLDLGQAAGA